MKARLIMTIQNTRCGRKPREVNMRKTRSDCTVGSFEKRNGFAPGTFRHPSGRDMRSDKTFGALRKENKDKQKKN